MNVELPETLVIIESVVYNSKGFAICLMRKKKRSHTNPPNAETPRFGREIGKEPAPFTP
jgi:hypothetical protein